MLEELQIRPFQPDDQEEVRKLILASFGERFGFIDEALNPDLDDIMASYAYPEYIFLIAVCKGVLVGTGALLFEDEEAGTIVRVSTHRDYRRRGIGKAIMHALIGQAREKGCRYLQLSTNRDWFDAIVFYEQLGFSVVLRNEKGVKMIMNLSVKKVRCQWAESNELFIPYHDEEWGVPVHDDRQLFEMLNLEGAQAGLSWLTILKKREHYREVFDYFDAEKIVNYDAAKKEALLNDAGIVRNRLKINAVVENAKAFLEVQREFGSFDAYIWQFVDGKPLTDAKEQNAIAKSELMSKDLKKRGFRFVGATICYAFMQAVGMVDDHAPDCFRANMISGTL